MHGSVVVPITRIAGTGGMSMIFKIGGGHRWFTLGSKDSVIIRLDRAPT
ncbi:MAG: hypothetical protein NNA25_08050 [Nitrospira sp.]|nr:hypothetical protein [Nitrospira sp.]